MTETQTHEEKMAELRRRFKDYWEPKAFLLMRQGKRPQAIAMEELHEWIKWSKETDMKPPKTAGDVLASARALADWRKWRVQNNL